MSQHPRNWDHMLWSWIHKNDLISVKIRTQYRKLFTSRRTIILAYRKYAFKMHQWSNTCTHSFINITLDLNKTIIRDSSLISCHKCFNISILFSFSFQLINDQSLKKPQTLFLQNRHLATMVSQHNLFRSAALISPLRLIVKQSLIIGIHRIVKQ